MKFGRLPTILPPNALRLGTYITPDIAPPPDLAAWGKDGRYSVLGNDTVGDCVIAGMYHTTQDFVIDNGGTFDPTTDDALATYSAITGYVKGDDSTDNGTDPVQAMEYWKTSGIQGHKITEYLALDPTDETQLRVAIWLFGNVGFAWDVPAYAMDQFNAGKPFDIDDAGDATIEGGHYTPFNGYQVDATSGLLTYGVVTWGKLTGMTARFASAFGEIPLVVLGPDWIDKVSEKSPSGFDVDRLLADLKQLGSL